MLVVVFGCERRRTYLYDPPFTVTTDRKPLEMVMQKSRLQRMLLRILEYDANVQYKPCRMMLASDSLSHLPADRVSMNIEMRVGLIHFSPEGLEELRRAIASEEELSLVRHIIVEG